jgi:cobaltochelatase CobT
MLLNDNILEEFKRSLAATVKSIGKSESIEVNFVQEESSISEEVINLIEPNIKSLKKNLSYIRDEADSMALIIRFHKKLIHNQFTSLNDTANEIFNAVEQSRIETQGSNIFKGINKNILNKHKVDLNNVILKHDKDSEIIKAFKYVSYSELSNNKLERN